MLNYPLLFIGLVAGSLTALISYTLAPSFIQLAHALNFLDRPTERKRHKKPTPLFGGTIIFISFWLVILSGLLIAHLFGAQLETFAKLPPILLNIHPWLPTIGGVFLGNLIVWALGLVDDRVNLSPFIKFFGQGLAALVLLSIGLRVNLAEAFGPIGYVITFFWIILLMNAFNFIDSIDGHCLGIAIISSLFFFFITQMLHQAAVSLLVITFAGALIGFFPYNFKPARCFLGDNGSLTIGYMLAVITLLCRYSLTPQTRMTPFIPILMFGVPIYDTISVIVVRIFRGIPPWKGDRNHLAHRLVRLGMGDKTAALSSYFIAVTLGLVALLSTQIRSHFGNILLLLLFCSIICVIALFEYYAATRIRMMEQMAQYRLQRRGDASGADDSD